MSGIHRKRLPVRVSIRSAGGTNSSANSFEVTNGGSANSSTNASQQSNASDSNNGNGSTKKRGRKKGSRTKLKIPQRGRKIELIPRGDEQFKYAVYPQVKGDPKYGSQMGFLLKREYPGLIKEKDENGVVIRERVATSWTDYYANGDEIGVTSADRVKQEFWNVFCVNIDQKVHADRNLENYATKQVRQMMYQAHVDGVKGHYDINGEEIDDTLARPRELEADEYKEGLVNWCNENTWEDLSNYWCTKEFLKKRKRGQEARLKSEDVAQNRGGSRPLTETQQLLDNYLAGLKKKHPNTWQQQQELDGEILYDINGGLPNGHVPIGSGAVCKDAILVAAKSSNVKPTNSIAFRTVLRQNEQLMRQNEFLTRNQSRTNKLLMALYAKLGEQIPEDLEDDEQFMFEQGANSSHAGSHPPENTCFNNNGGNDSGCGNDCHNHNNKGNHTTNSNMTNSNTTNSNTSE